MSQDHSHPVTPVSTYVGVFFALMVLTVVTVAVAVFDLGAFNTPIALAIAGAKACLVVWFFMEVRHVKPLTKLAVISGLVWLVLLLVLTFNDYVSRDWVAPPLPW